MNNKVLSIIFVVLLAIYLMTQLFGGQKETSIDRSALLIDTSSISKLIIHPKSSSDEVFSIERNDGDWVITKDDLAPSVNTYAVQSLLRTLSGISIERLVSKSEDRWQDYEVTEENSTRIEVFEGTKKVKDLVIGRFNFNQATRSATSYVRLFDEKDIYSVDGFLSMTLGQEFDNYRDKALVNFSKEELNHILISSDQQEIPFKLDGNDWVSNEGKVDSSGMASYLNSLSGLQGSTFYDNGDIGSMPLAHRVTFTTVKDQKNIEVRTKDGQFIINSSDNPEAYFSSDSSGVYQRIVGDLLELVN